MASFRKYPSVASLQCFEVAARHLSFTKAAQELCLTQSAISKQVAQLEELLQVGLFERTGQSLYLTPIGKKYYLDTQKVLNQLEQATLQVQAHTEGSQTLSIISHPTFCAKWLIPVLKDFSKTHHIHLDITEPTSPFVSKDDCDVAFLYGNGAWRDMQALHLFDEEMAAVCQADYLPKPLASLDDMKDHTLIQSNARPRLWQQYFEAQKAALSGSFVGPRFETFYACISAALLGYGIALVPNIMVQQELKQGSLVLAWDYVHKGVGAYYLVCPYDKIGSKKVKTLTDWVMARLSSPEVY